MPVRIVADSTITATLPEGTTHFYSDLIDEHQFVVSYPEVEKERGKRQKSHAQNAIEAGDG